MDGLESSPIATTTYVGIVSHFVLSFHISSAVVSPKLFASRRISGTVVLRVPQNIRSTGVPSARRFRNSIASQRGSNSKLTRFGLDNDTNPYHIFPTPDKRLLSQQE